MPVSLTINQRNLYLYFLHHRRKNPRVPCYVPKVPMQASRTEDHLIALQRLEEQGLVRVDRSTSNYTGWVMLPPLGQAPAISDWS